MVLIVPDTVRVSDGQEAGQVANVVAKTGCWDFTSSNAKLGEQTGNSKRPLISKFTCSDTLPSGRLHHLKLPKRLHQLGTKCKISETVGDISFKPQHLDFAWSGLCAEKCKVAMKVTVRNDNLLVSGYKNHYIKVSTIFIRPWWTY